jgi:hypothetical protein
LSAWADRDPAVAKDFSPLRPEGIMYQMENTGIVLRALETAAFEEGIGGTMKLFGLISAFVLGATTAFAEVPDYLQRHLSNVGIATDAIAEGGIHVFEGDATGDGADDALTFV